MLLLFSRACFLNSRRPSLFAFPVMYVGGGFLRRTFLRALSSASRWSSGEGRRGHLLFARLPRVACRFSFGRRFSVFPLDLRANKLGTSSALRPRLRFSLLRVGRSVLFCVARLSVLLFVFRAQRDEARWGGIGREEASAKRNGADMSRKRPRDWGIAVPGARRRRYSPVVAPRAASVPVAVAFFCRTRWPPELPTKQSEARAVWGQPFYFLSPRRFTGRCASLLRRGDMDNADLLDASRSGLFSFNLDAGPRFGFHASFSHKYRTLVQL